MKFIIVDDHAISREGLYHLLRRIDSQAQVLQAGDFAAAIRLFDEHEDIDLVLLDLGLPDLDGLAGLTFIRRHHGSLPVAILSAEEDAHVIRQALARGVLGYIPKSSSGETMAQAIKLILGGGVYSPPAANAATGPAPDANAVLTERQIEVLRLIAMGKTNQQVAVQLGVSENTIRVHVSAIFKSLGVGNRTEAVYAARRHGIDIGDLPRHGE